MATPRKSGIGARPRFLLKIARRMYSIAASWLLVPLAVTLVGVMVIDPSTKRIMGPDQFKIYVVGDFDDDLLQDPHDPASSIPSPAEQIFESFNSSGISQSKVDDTQLEVVKENDHGDSAQDGTIAQQLAAEPDTLMIIGAMGSTAAKTAFPFYLNAKPPIPVILTMETSPHLLPAVVGDEEGFRPVFRLSPTDYKQAQAVAELMDKSGAQKIWVVEDTDNRVYADFLAEEFIRRVQKSGQSRVLLWSTNATDPTSDHVHALGIDWVFFIGRWQRALVLVRELKAVYGPSVPGIVLSDTSVDKELINEGANDVEKVYLTNQMSATDYKDGNGYRSYGEDAGSVVKELLSNITTSSSCDEKVRGGGFAYKVRRLFGIKRVADARRAMIAVMHEESDRNKLFILTGRPPIQFGSDKDQDPSERGLRVDANAKFQIWRIMPNRHASDAFTESGSDSSSLIFSSLVDSH